MDRVIFEQEINGDGTNDDNLEEEHEDTDDDTPTNDLESVRNFVPSALSFTTAKVLLFYSCYFTC